MNFRLMRVTSRLLIVSFLGLCLPLQSVHAGLVETDKVAASAQFQPERERIRTFLDREDVRKELQAQGVDAAAAKARVDALTDEEVQKVAGKLDKIPAAGSDILGILFTIFIVLLVTDILGFTKVFSFTHPIR